MASTVIVEVVGEELQVPADQIELTQLDSSVVPSDGGVGGRPGNAGIRKCCL